MLYEVITEYGYLAHTDGFDDARDGWLRGHTTD